MRAALAARIQKTRYEVVRRQKRVNPGQQQLVGVENIVVIYCSEIRDGKQGLLLVVAKTSGFALKFKDPSATNPEPPNFAPTDSGLPSN